MKKSFVLVLMSALLVFALIACGQTASEPEAPQGGAEDTVSSATPEADANQPVSDTPKEGDSQPATSKTLVAYFSRAGENYSVGVVEKGNTEIIAEMIAEAVGADLGGVLHVGIQLQIFSSSLSLNPATQSQSWAHTS